MKTANKLVIGILILLVLYAAGVGFYAYTLNQDIDRLGECLSALEAEQINRLDALDAGLIDLEHEALDGLYAVQKAINEVAAIVEDMIIQVQDMDENVLEFAINLDSLQERINNLEGEIAEALVDSEDIYEQVSPAVVRISDGEHTLGSGVIMDTESHVITAQHVIDGMTDIYVVTYGGLVARATLVGECEFSDIAVLELDKDPGVSPPPFADSSLITPGTPVVAIGSPSIDESEMRDTLTEGIISQVNRQIKIEEKWVSNLLQFDAAVNFGNSGCPLFNAEGEIAGIVIARISPTVGDGIYFAVSANKAKRVANEIIEKGFFDYPWLGVIIEDLLPEEVYDLELETGNGVYVNGVFSQSPAEAAGITAGDVIVSVNGVAMRNMADLTSYLAEYTSPGDIILMEILRDNVTIELSVELGKRE